MSVRKHHWVVWTVMVAMLVATSGCGSLLYPERKTAKLSTEKDTTVIVYDCLWLLAGVIPGVVALVVDGVNDTWYYTEAEAAARVANDRTQMDASRGADLAVRLHGKAPADATVTLTLTDSLGTELASVAVTADPTNEIDTVALPIPADLSVSEATLVLAVNGQTQLMWDIRIID